MLSPDYVVGLIDGEGSFTVFVRNKRDSNERIRRVRAEPRFYVKLIERDKSILLELKKFFGCGNVYFQKDKRQNHQQCYRYEVANRKELENIIIPFFKKYQPKLDSKKKDFKIFCQLIKMMAKGDHLKEDGLDKMYQVKQKMH